VVKPEMFIISQKRDDFWLLRCYAPGGVGSYNGWYASLPIHVQTEIDNVLEILVATRNWPNGPNEITEEMRGACTGLVEIRVNVQGQMKRHCAIDCLDFLVREKENSRCSTVSEKQMLATMVQPAVLH
jgi:hypothetical protein